MPLALDSPLQKMLSPDWAVLLVVDVQNDFCHPEGLFGRMGFDLSSVHAAVERLKRVIEGARSVGVPVVFVQLVHNAATNSRAWANRSDDMREDACKGGTWGADLYEVGPVDDEPVVVKRRYSPFVGTDLDYILRAAERKSLLVTGVSSNICVEQTLRDGFMRDYHVVLIEDCAAAYSAQSHASTIANVQSFLGRVVTSQSVLENWQDTYKNHESSPFSRLDVPTQV